jgi:hypothetical protein
LATDRTHAALLFSQKFKLQSKSFKRLDPGIT